MENMDKGLTVPNWVLISWPKIPQMPPNLSAQVRKFGIPMKKRLHWVSVIRGINDSTFEWILQESRA